MFRALLMCVALAGGAAYAQDDDLAPLPTAKPKPKPPPARPKATRPPPPKAKPAPVVDEDLPALPPSKGDLVIKLTNNVKGAHLQIDDKDVGTLPQPAQQLPAGEHTITVHRVGFAPITKKVTITGNKTNEVAVTLEASAGVLTVSADVAGAQVFVNGHLAGTAPLVDLEVPAGMVEISVKKDGYRDGSQQVSVKAGRDYPLEVKLGAPIAAATTAVAVSDAPVASDLAPHDAVDADGVTGTTQHYDNSPVYTRWWFWTAAVIVVGGIVGVTAALLLTKGSGTPTFVPLSKSNFSCQMGGMMCDGWINPPNGIVPMH